MKNRFIEVTIIFHWLFYSNELIFVNTHAADKVGETIMKIVCSYNM